VKSANSSFDPFKRQEFDRRNQGIHTLHKQGVTVCELAQRNGLEENGCGGFVWRVLMAL
jgi:hypothetical protein